ncbi:MAG: hypothetical protein N3E45_01715 [Oscillatoriaceae bacterium SKW80]|nr:hypothetical protein [Oscillatoriaceae bacterium SKYG93]MCX8119546.1 hypothetical protein [Oscillatoriaceae bacterium SKW80]MDW8455013.1 hypothetical protein [Oscillatoriaceae cyanobacterium SKYGB_i_bin93]HIK28211.1 hypothetical protein [Oscillatoriaceae cyanobacterium M7585_C2015_266]
MYMKCGGLKLLLFSAIASAIAVGLVQVNAYGIEKQNLTEIITKLCSDPKPTTTLPDLKPIELKTASSGNIITADTIFQERLTIPSLWWADEQFGGKLLDNWIAYVGTNETPPRVDLIVNRQLWSLLNYLERYRFVNQFGTIARNYGYNVRVFNRQGVFLAAYTCAGSSDSNVCSVCLEAGARARRVGR